MMRVAALPSVSGPRRHRAWLRLGLSNMHRPGSANAAAAGRPRPWVDHAVGRGADPGATSTPSSPARCRRAHPASSFIDIQNDELARFRSLVAASPGATDLHEVPSLRARIVSLNGVPAERVHVEPRQPVGAARRPRADLRGGRAGRLAGGPTATGGRPTTPGPPLLSLDCGVGAWLAPARRRHAARQRARPRRRLPHRQFARDRLAGADHKLHPGGFARAAGARAADAHCDPARPAGSGLSFTAAGDRRAAQRHRHPGRRRAGQHRRAGGQAWRQHFRLPAGSPWPPARWCWPARWAGGPAAAHRRGGGAEDARGHQRAGAGGLAGGVRRHWGGGGSDRGGARYVGELGGDALCAGRAVVVPAGPRWPRRWAAAWC